MLEGLHGALRLPQDRRGSAFPKLKTNFSVSTWRCSGDRLSIISSIVWRPIESSAPDSADGISAPVGSGTSASGCHRRDARKWSIARLCAMRKSQALNGADRQRKRLIDSSIFRNVCVVKVLGVAIADAQVEVAVDAVEAEEVGLLERVAFPFCARATRARISSLLAPGLAAAVESVIPGWMPAERRARNRCVRARRGCRAAAGVDQAPKPTRARARSA